MKTLELKVGADPEFFVNEKGDANILPAVGMIKGGKYDPVACLRGAMQVDGVALEFNITPASNVKEFCRNIQSVKRSTLKEARKNTGLNLEINKSVLNHFHPNVLSKFKESDIELGCSPDYSSSGHSKTGNGGPDNATRVVGGHIHLGWTEDEDISQGSTHFLDCCALAMLMDVVVQIPYLKLLVGRHGRNILCEESERKGYYGNWGSFRPKSYGMEYRSLSNRWIHNRADTAFIYERSVLAFRLASETSIVEALRAHPNNGIRFCFTSSGASMGKYPSSYSQEEWDLVESVIDQFTKELEA